MNHYDRIKLILQDLARGAQKNAIYYKTGVGEYAEHDQFIGVNVPSLRIVAKQFADLNFAELQSLLESPVNEERLLALLILVTRYQKGDGKIRLEVYQYYVRNLQYVNNWNLVDASAHLIIGMHLLERKRDYLIDLAQSDNVWRRRVSIVATWFFIRHNDLAWTFKLAEILLHDAHDLMHKAVGWMLREAGKRNQQQLIQFLDLHAVYMPRTMLRYAIEKFPKDQRNMYRAQKRITMR